LKKVAVRIVSGAERTQVMSVSILSSSHDLACTKRVPGFTRTILRAPNEFLSLRHKESHLRSL